VATETATVMETAMVTATKTMPMPTMGHQQQQQQRRVWEVPHSKRPHCCLCLQFLDGEAPFFMKVSKLGCHKKVLKGLWGHTQLFG
jgi:hypothetical protein